MNKLKLELPKPMLCLGDTTCTKCMELSNRAHVSDSLKASLRTTELHITQYKTRLHELVSLGTTYHYVGRIQKAGSFRTCAWIYHDSTKVVRWLRILISDPDWPSQSQHGPMAKDPHSAVRTVHTTLLPIKRWVSSLELGILLHIGSSMLSSSKLLSRISVVIGKVHLRRKTANVNPEGDINAA